MTIKQKANGAGIVWDADNNKPLLIFKGGLCVTSDVAVAKKAKNMGYEVEGLKADDAEGATEKPKRSKKS